MSEAALKNLLNKLFTPHVLGDAFCLRLLVKGPQFVLMMLGFIGGSFWLGLSLLDSKQIASFRLLYDVIEPVFNSINHLLPWFRPFPGINPALIIFSLLLIAINVICFFLFQQIMVKKYALQEQGIRAARVAYLLALLMLFAGITVYLSQPKGPSEPDPASVQSKQVVAGKSTDRDTQLPPQILIESALILGIVGFAKGLDSLPTHQSTVNYTKFRVQLLSALDQLEQGRGDCISARDRLHLNRIIGDLESAGSVLKENFGSEPKRYQTFLTEHFEKNILALQEFLNYCKDEREEFICELYTQNAHDLAAAGNRAFRDLETLMRKGGRMTTKSGDLPQEQDKCKGAGDAETKLSDQRFIRMVVFSPNIKDNDDLNGYSPFHHLKMCEIIREVRNRARERNDKSGWKAYYDSHCLYPYYVASPITDFSEPLKKDLKNLVMRALVDCKIFDGSTNSMIVKNAREAIKEMHGKVQSKVFYEILSENPANRAENLDLIETFQPFEIKSEDFLLISLERDLLEPLVSELNKSYPSGGD